MKQILLFILGAALFIVAVGLLTQRVNKSAPPAATKTISLGNTKVNAEIAKTEEVRRQGLSGRRTLGESSGMLFVFDRIPLVQSFWMKDMLIPLDIIWIQNSEVVQIDKNVQPPKKGTPDSALPLIVPKKPIDYVLEVNAGFTDKNGIVEGTPVDLSGI